MGRPAGWMKELTGRSLMKSPGAPCSSARGRARVLACDRNRGHEREGCSGCWGVAGCGESVVPSWWWDGSDGLGQVSGRYLSFGEREEIALLRVKGDGVRSIARQIGRSPSTVSRELRRNAATRGGKLEYRASVAQWKSDLSLSAQRQPNLSPIHSSATMCKTDCPGCKGPDGEVVGPAGPAWNRSQQAPSW